MKDKYRILNDVKVNIDEYEEVKFDNNDNIKQRMKKKLRNRKTSYRNAIAIASAVILGSSVMLNENVWAHVQSIWYTIDEVFRPSSAALPSPSSSAMKMYGHMFNLYGIQ